MSGIYGRAIEAISPGETQQHGTPWEQDVTAAETFSTLRQFWLKHYDAMEVLIMDQGTEIGADFQHLCQSRGILLVVTDMETPWQNFVVERHGALFKMAFEKACSLEAPTTEAEVDEVLTLRLQNSIDAWDVQDFRPVNEFFGRQLQLPSSLLEDDFLDPRAHLSCSRLASGSRLRSWMSSSHAWHSGSLETALVVPVNSFVQPLNSLPYSVSSLEGSL